MKIVGKIDNNVLQLLVYSMTNSHSKEACFRACSRIVKNNYPATV